MFSNKGVPGEVGTGSISLLIYFFYPKLLKVQSYKLYDNKYMMVLTQISNTENFAFIPVLVFTFLSRKVLFINRKDNRNC